MSKLDSRFNSFINEHLPTLNARIHNQDKKTITLEGLINTLKNYANQLQPHNTAVATELTRMKGVLKPIEDFTSKQIAAGPATLATTEIQIRNYMETVLSPTLNATAA